MTSLQIITEISIRANEIEAQLKRVLLVNNPEGLKKFKSLYGQSTFADVASMLARKDWNAKH